MTAYVGNPHDCPVWEEISDEAAAAERKFGRQVDLDEIEWFAVLAEEFGEVAMDITKRNVPPVGADAPGPLALRREVVQVAAVCARWLEVMDRRSGR